MNPFGTGAARRTTSTLAPTATTLILAAVLAACGSSASSSSTTASPAGGGTSPTPTASSNKLEQFAQCMRSHGAANFPDPTAQGTFQLSTALTASPQFRAADDACKSLAPPGPLKSQAPTTADLNKALKFVHCMRKQGINMADPNPQGLFTSQLAASGIDPNSPQFKQALFSCRSLLPPGNGFGTGH
jgi:hypothetical protein